MPDIDFAAVFQAAPSPVLLLTCEFVIIDANRAYLEMTGRARGELDGQDVFAAFLDDPDDPDADGSQNLRASLNRVLATRERDVMAMQRWDVQRADRPGVFEERYWSPVNVPVIGPDGEVSLIIHRVEEMTELVNCRRSQGTLAVGRGVLGNVASTQGILDPGTAGLAPAKPGLPAPAADGPTALERMEAELFSRSRDLHDTLEQLRRSHDREREVARTLQEAMLPTTLPEVWSDVVVRYLPASDGLTVCGDWYDVVDLSNGRVAVAVGDVVGRGLTAACVMGQLRSALSAAIRAVQSPAEALDLLGVYARSLEGALATTVVQAVIDQTRRTITYSLAGHLPPALLHSDGTVELLDKTLDPPLGVWLEHVPRSEATTTFSPGSMLVLYTDGLVERRDEDIDAGLHRLTMSIARHGGLDPHGLADKLLFDLGSDAGLTDDTALVVIGL